MGIVLNLGRKYKRDCAHFMTIIILQRINFRKGYTKPKPIAKRHYWDNYDKVKLKMVNHCPA